MIPFNRSFYIIINPISGRGKGKLAATEIEKIFSKRNIRYEIIFTTKSGEAVELAKKAIHENFDVIVAVGGDGTVNEIAGEVSKSKKNLGIIPIGSGNGLARDLGIPVNIKAAIKNLLLCEEKVIDVGYCNDHFFGCTAGVGFDAYMGEKFKNLENRGLMGYVKTFLKEFFNYKTQDYIIKFDEKEIKVNAFLITIANCKQWGNNFYISPKSKNNDGKLEICVIKKFPKIIFPILVYRILCKTIHKSTYCMYFQSKYLTIETNGELTFHTDGEPFNNERKVEFHTKTAVLSVISMK